MLAMKVVNTTRDRILAETIINATSIKDQSLGLLQHKDPTAMLIKTRFGIHTFFMKYPIDVLILDQQNFVVKLKENMQPNTIFLWNPKYETVIELPVKTINVSNTQLGDSIILT
jgi:uncharacterized protein